jgi:hypothetical protein
MLLQKDKTSDPKVKDQMVAALARWDGEGGAQDLPWALRHQCGDLGETERRILECLGASLVSGWNELPRGVQRAIFRHAAADKTYDPPRLKAQIARFLHDHKDDAESQ